MSRRKFLKTVTTGAGYSFVLPVLWSCGGGTGTAVAPATSPGASTAGSGGNPGASNWGVGGSGETGGTAGGPVIFYSDLDSGPGTGGENNLGVYVTITGARFGSSQGSGTVTVGGAKATVFSWSPTQIVFQPGPNAVSGNIVVAVPGGTSNGVPFTVRAGRVYYAAVTAQGQGDGSSSANAMTATDVYANIKAGDTYYFLGGVYSGAGNGNGYGTTNYAQASWAFDYTKSGAVNNNVGIIGYPGHTVQFGAITASTIGTQSSGITTIYFASVPSTIVAGMSVNGGGDASNTGQAFSFDCAVISTTSTSVTVSSPTLVPLNPNTTIFFNAPEYGFFPRNQDLLITYTTTQVSSGSTTMTVASTAGIAAGMALVGGGQGGTGIGNFLGSILVSSVSGSVVTFDNPIPCAFPANWYFGFSVPGTVNSCANYLTFANLTFASLSSCISTGSYASNPPSLAGCGSIGNRFVNNTFHPAYIVSSAIVVIGGNYNRVLGNHFIYRTLFSNLTHGTYQDCGACYTEIAWNWFDNCTLGYVMQYHMDNTNGLSHQAFDQMGISNHDNIISASDPSTCRGITVSNLGPASYGNIYNNLLINVGQGVSCVSVFSGTWNIYNNTFYNCKVQAAITLDGPSGPYQWTPNANVYNNIIHVTSGSLYLQYAQPNSPFGTLQVSNNLYFGAGTGPDGNGPAVFTDAGAVNADPKFVSPQTPAQGTLNGGDYHLQTDSPAIGAGTSSVSSVVLANRDGVAWGNGPYDIGAF